jgi:hypothetical protein
MRRLLRAKALRSGLLPRLLFLAVLGGGLLWWADLRKPRDLRLSVDLTEALPGHVREVDVVVRRAGHVLARHDIRYGEAGAPATVDVIVHAAPGQAEVETTLAYGATPARRSVSPRPPSPSTRRRRCARAERAVHCWRQYTWYWKLA